MESIVIGNGNTDTSDDDNGLCFIRMERENKYDATI